MAAVNSSPVLSNNGSETSGTTVPSTPPSSINAAVKSPNFSTVPLQRSEPPKSQRGLNKPKCVNCGNVARSRCPYRSCKSCCAKAQNPCHIHVLKPNSTLADRGTAPSSTVPEQQPNEAPTPGPLVKPNSLRHLSSAFAQFNNVHIPVRSRKPLTRKEALTLNEWRFSKLKEYKEANIEAENEAFDRYMHNISLLEEVFEVNFERSEEKKDDFMVSNPPTTSSEKSDIILETKVNLRSNPIRVDTFRKRIRQSIDQGLRKLQKYKSTDDHVNLDNVNDSSLKVTKSCWAGKTSDFTQLNFKLNQAVNEEDLKVCKEMKLNITGEQKISSGNKIESSDLLEEQNVKKDLVSVLERDVSLKLVRSSEIDQDILNQMDSHFSNLEEIEDL